MQGVEHGPKLAQVRQNMARSWSASTHFGRNRPIVEPTPMQVSRVRPMLGRSRSTFRSTQPNLVEHRPILGEIAPNLPGVGQLVGRIRPACGRTWRMLVGVGQVWSRWARDWPKSAYVRSKSANVGQARLKFSRCLPMLVGGGVKQTGRTLSKCGRDSCKVGRSPHMSNSCCPGQHDVSN